MICVAIQKVVVNMNSNPLHTQVFQKEKNKVHVSFIIVNSSVGGKHVSGPHCLQLH